MAAQTESSLVADLHDVKMLLVLQALASGCQQKHIAAALGVSEATVSGMPVLGTSTVMRSRDDRRNKSFLQFQRDAPHHWACPSW